MEQLSFSSYSHNVAHVFNSEKITNLCSFIDNMTEKGMKCKDMKEWLLAITLSSFDYSVKSEGFKPYHEAVNFIKNDLSS